MNVFILFGGSLGLLFFICWATYKTAILLRRIKIPFNMLLRPEENAVRFLMIGLCLAIGLGSGIPPAQMGLTADNFIQEILVGIFVGILLDIFLSLAASIAIATFGKQIYSPVVTWNVLPRRNIEWILVPLAMIPAVILEELLFRGLLVGAFSLFFNPYFLAIAVSIVFGLVHLPQGRLGIVITALASLVLSLLFIWRGSLVAPIVAHYVVNILQIISTARSKEWQEELSQESNARP